MSSAQFKLDMFEGPLDLLLHLISKHKLNIHDIEISLLLEQYMEYIHQLEHEDLEDAADFLEMAARLIYIKTVSLLPHDEEAQELKKELEGRLIEYSQCKYLASILAKGYAGGEIFVRKPVVIPVDKTYTREHDPSVLFEAYIGLSEKARNEKPINAKLFQPIVSYKVVSVGSKIVYILKKLYTVGVCDLSHIYDGMETKSERVATFLAILELTKSGKICLNDDNTEISFSDRSRTRKKFAEKPAETEPATEAEAIPEMAETEPVTEAEAIPEVIETEQVTEAETVPEVIETEQATEAEAIPETSETEPATEVEAIPETAETEQATEAEAISEVTETEQVTEAETVPEPVTEQPKIHKPIAERVAYSFDRLYFEPVLIKAEQQPEEQTETVTQIQTAAEAVIDTDIADVLIEQETHGCKAVFKPNYWASAGYYWGTSPVGDDLPRNCWRYGTRRA